MGGWRKEEKDLGKINTSIKVCLKEAKGFENRKRTPGGCLVTDLVRKFEGWGPRKEMFRFGDNNSLESPNKRQRRADTPSRVPGTPSVSTYPPRTNSCPGTPPTTPHTLPCTPSRRRQQARQGSRPRRTLTRRPESPTALSQSCSDSPIDLTTSTVRVTHPSLTVFGHPLELLQQRQGRLHLPAEGPGTNHHHQHHNTPGVREIIRKIDNKITKPESNDRNIAENVVDNIAEEEDKDKGRKRISIRIQKFSRIENQEEESQEAYLQVPGPGAEASCTTRSPASSSSVKSLEISTSPKSRASVASLKSSTVPESSGAGLGKSTSSISNEHFVFNACSCSNAATRSSAVLAGNQYLNYTHEFGGKKTILGRNNSIISNENTSISGQLGQSGDQITISPGITHNIRQEYNPKSDPDQTR